MENLKCKCGKEMSCGMKTMDWESMRVMFSYRCYECGEKATAFYKLKTPNIRFESDKSEGTELVCVYSIDSTFKVGERYIIKRVKEYESRNVYYVDDEKGNEWLVALDGYLYKFELI